MALAHVVGSPMVNALRQRIEADQMLTIPMAWAARSIYREAAASDLAKEYRIPVG